MGTRVWIENESARGLPVKVLRCERIGERRSVCWSPMTELMDENDEVQETISREWFKDASVKSGLIFN